MEAPEKNFRTALELLAQDFNKKFTEDKKNRKLEEEKKLAYRNNYINHHQQTIEPFISNIKIILSQYETNLSKSEALNLRSDAPLKSEFGFSIYGKDINISTSENVELDGMLINIGDKVINSKFQDFISVERLHTKIFEVIHPSTEDHSSRAKTTFNLSNIGKPPKI